MGLCQSRSKVNGIPDRRIRTFRSHLLGRETNSKMISHPQHDNDVALRKRSTRRTKRPAPKAPGHDQRINQASLINPPKGHQGAHFNQGSATIPAPDVNTKRSPTRPISGPAKQTQGLQENRSAAMTADSSTTHPKKTEQSQTTNKTPPVNTPDIVQVDQKCRKRERAHVSDNSKSSHKNSQIRRNKMMNSSPLDDQNVCDTKPNFPPPDQNHHIQIYIHMHNYDANKGGTSSAHTCHGAANSAILEGKQNSENAMSDFYNKIDERESTATLKTNSNLTISTREEPCKAVIGVSNCLQQLSEAEMEKKIQKELNSLHKSINKLGIEIENYSYGKGHTRYYYLDDQLLKLMYKVDDVKLNRYSPLRKNKLQLCKDLEGLDDLLKTKA